MSDHNTTDWERLVWKTRRRALIWYPVARDTPAGMKVCTKRSELIFFVPSASVFGSVLVCAALFWIDIVLGQALCLVVGVFLLSWVAHSVFFPRSLFLPKNSDEVVVFYGFFLYPTSLVLDRNSITVDYQTGAETKLHSSMKGFKIISLRHVDTKHVAHVGFTMRSEDALRVFDPLSKLLAEGGRNCSIAVITLEDGTPLKVDRFATWAAGHHRKYKNRLSVGPNSAEIERRAFGESGSVVDRKADIYPIRIETNTTSICLLYSNEDQKSIPRYDCVAIQLCKEEIAERYSRYEVNLIEDAFLGKRVNLMSFDISPRDSDAEPRSAADQLGKLIGCVVVDHC